MTHDCYNIHSRGRDGMIPTSGWCPHTFQNTTDPTFRAGFCARELQHARSLILGTAARQQGFDWHHLQVDLIASQIGVSGIELQVRRMKTISARLLSMYVLKRLIQVTCSERKFLVCRRNPWIDNQDKSCDKSHTVQVPKLRVCFSGSIL